MTENLLPLTAFEEEMIGTAPAELLLKRFTHAKLRRLHPRVHARIDNLVGKDVDELVVPATNCELPLMAKTFSKAIESDDLEIIGFGRLTVQKSLDLADRIRLVPATEFSQSGYFHNYFRARQELPIYRWQPPSAVLLSRLTFSSIFVSVGALTELDWQVLDQLHDIRNCLALSGPVAIAGDTQWIEFLDPDLNDYNSGIWSRAQEIQPHNLDFGSFDPDLAKTLVPKFLALAGEQRSKIYLATDRFVRALWRHNASEAALELGITLDSLLGDGAGELVFKVGLRAALLLGGNLSDRRRRREIVKSVYDLRSKVVHTGTSDKAWKFKGQQMPTKNFVELAIGVTAEVVREIIILGQIPNWNDVELSGKVSRFNENTPNQAGNEHVPSNLSHETNRRES